MKSRSGNSKGNPRYTSSLRIVILERTVQLRKNRVHTGVSPHDRGIMQHLPTVRVPAHHSHAVVKPDVIVESPVIFRSVQAHGAVPVCYFPRQCLSLELGSCHSSLPLPSTAGY